MGAATPLRVMTSSGALQAPDKLKAKDTILSGPAAGMVGAIAAARMAGFDGVPVLGFDMGARPQMCSAWLLPMRRPCGK